MNDRSLSSLTPLLTGITLFSSLVSAYPSGGDHTVDLKGSVTLLGQAPLTVDNIFSGTNASWLASSYLRALTSLLLRNEFDAPQIDRLALTVHLSPRRRTAVLEKIWHDRARLRPGDPLHLAIFVKPYQDSTRRFDLTLHLPPDVPAGPLTVLVADEESTTARERQAAPQRFQPRSLEQLLTLLNRPQRNDRLTIRILKKDSGAVVAGQDLPHLPPSVLSILGSGRTAGEVGALREIALAEESLALPYVITGAQEFTITVER